MNHAVIETLQLLHVCVDIFFPFFFLRASAFAL